jgi:hypothetical protein
LEKDTKTLFLKGLFATGEGVINLLKECNPLLVTDINSLKNLNDEYKAIIFDDLNWSDIP